MIIPYDTDAPIYHYPIATTSIIAVNVLAFLSLLGEGQVEPWILEWGNGLHPIQWVTSNFMHAGIGHLLGNMLFLWVYGLIVEGKIGWWKFLVVYLGIGIVQCAIEQTMTLGATGGGSLGASSIIFGLMAMSLVWAPKNDVQCMFFIYYHPFFFDCPVLVLAGIWFMGEVVIWFAISTAHFGVGFAITSQVLHLMGVGLGFGVGTLMLKFNWVDCEGWDLYSVLAGRHEMSEEKWEKLREETPEQEEDIARRSDAALTQIRQIIEDGQPALAYRAHLKMKHTLAGWVLPETDMLRIIAAYHQLGQWSDSVPAMVEYIKSYEQHSSQVRFRLAQILLERQRRPADALRVIAGIRQESLSPKKREQLDVLRRKAAQMHDLDPYEVPSEDW